ncbi:MAG TPA: hypothetical protein VG798_03745, partial [Rhizomicrobium sp.]|nr:hypothetical protein [Rhizomicrobium sp.]
MGLEAEKLEKSEDASARLIAAGRALLAQGDARFSLTRLCSEAGMTLDDFRASFASKAELLQQLMAQDAQKDEAPQPQPPQADPWLERRLRVFERALTALEEKSEKRDHEYRQAIAVLEEKLAGLSGAGRNMVGADATEAVIAPAPREAEAGADAVSEPQVLEQPETPEAEEAAAPAPNPLALPPLEQYGPPARADSEFLEAGRRAALAHARALEQTARRRPVSRQLLLAAALATVTLLFCAVLALGHAGLASAAPAEGTAHRQTALAPLAVLAARADSGDVAAQRDLALAYLRGRGVTKDIAAAARWAQAAAEQGDAEAQYLAGCLTRDGAAGLRDPARAFAWFNRAAAAGQLAAMHNL